MIPDGSGRGSGAGAKACGHNAGIPLTGLTAALSKRGMLFRREETVSVALGDNACNKCLLLHPRLGGKASRHVV